MSSRAGMTLKVRRRLLGRRNAILLKRISIIIPDTTKEKAYSPVIQGGLFARLVCVQGGFPVQAVAVRAPMAQLGG